MLVSQIWCPEIQMVISKKILLEKGTSILKTPVAWFVQLATISFGLK